MPAAPILYGLMALGGLALGTRALDEAGDAADSAARLAKWTTAAGGLYLAYQAARAAGWAR